MNTDNIRRYELMLILSGNLPEADYERELGEIRKFIQENTKGISYEDLWGKRDMAFQIKKQTRAYYIVFHFNASAEFISELRTTMKLNPVVLRNLIVSLPHDYEAGRYKTEMLHEEKVDQTNAPALSSRSPAPTRATPAALQKEKPVLAGKEDESKLKNVEKQLDQILLNPDIRVD